MTLDWHHVPGRLRLRLAALKGDERAALNACAAAQAIPGVVDARANPATGSLVIHYRSESLAPAGLWAALRRKGLVSGPSPLAGAPTPARAPVPEGGAERLYSALLRALLDRLARLLASALVGALL